LVSKQELLVHELERQVQLRKVQWTPLTVTVTE
jgi:hypothetical protein